MKKPPKKYRTQRTVTLDLDLNLILAGKPLLGSQRIALLESIEREGSITRAAKQVGLSYKTASDAVDAMNNLAEKPLLIRATGSQQGGGSYLTQHGRDAVRLYRLLETGHQRLQAKMLAHVNDLDKLNELVRAITMKTSARNQFRGTVRNVNTGAVNADVSLDLGDGLTIYANVTSEAVEDLQLKPGREAVALIKSSFILLSTDLDLRISARNRLRGTVTDIIPGNINSEVKLQIGAGRMLTAIVTNESVKELDLVEGSVCCALIKSSHVLIAVND